MIVAFVYLLCFGSITIFTNYHAYIKDIYTNIFFTDSAKRFANLYSPPQSTYCSFV